MSRLVLASKSPRRREILDSAGFVFEVTSSEIEEYSVSGETPSLMALRLACQKASAVSSRIQDAWVIGADTVVDLDGEPFSKPSDRLDALRMLRALNGMTHLVHTGVALANASEVKTSFVETTKVMFGTLRDDEILSFAESGDGDDKAGAYAIQGRGALLIERIDGCYYNVVGLPVHRLKKTIERFAPDLLPLLRPSKK
jgi:septum formation protein